MTFVALLLLAFGLAMDATAVAAARGMTVPVIRMRHVLLVAGLFGGFQALMPLIGWLIGAELGPYVQAWDHWVAFVLLAAIGGKMLWEARGQVDEQAELPAATRKTDTFALKVMVVLAIATSIDALAVGFTLPMLGAELAPALVTIGVTTALLSVAGLYAGRKLGAVLGKRLDVIGGLVLIGMGTKILIEHLSA